jgi:hypothetical protein
MELEIHGEKEKLTRLKKHLEEEHPSLRGTIELESDSYERFEKSGKEVLSKEELKEWGF